MSRRTNNELDALPGFFFYPSDTEGLVKLSLQERLELVICQGVYTAGLYNLGDSMQRADAECHVDNNRIPTHRRPDTPMPAYGSVPIDLRQVIEVK